MKKIVSILTFIFLLIIIIELRLRFVDNNTSSTSFVFMLLITVISSLYWGITAGFLMLIFTAGIIGYLVLTPHDITQLSMGEINQIGLFVLEGIIIIILVYIMRKSKEQEHELREKFQVILSSIGDAVIATDKKGNIGYMNARAQRLTDWKFRDAQKKKLLHIMQIEDTDIASIFAQNMEDVIRAGKSLMANKPMAIKNRRGKTLEIQDTIAPLKNMEGKIIGTVLIFKDVSSHRQIEEQKEVLLGAISHELKNYITSLQGYAHILNKRVKTTKDQQLIDFAEKLRNKIEAMKNMVISMLDLSKLNMGKLDMNIEEFDIEELILSTINDLEMNTKHIIKMKGSITSHVMADKMRIGQVLINLISNAIKYSPVDKDIYVILEQNDTEAIIGVQDFGKGIAEDKLEKVFQPFYRAVNEKEKMAIAGSGLGLYVSKEIIKQNSGDIWVKSEEGKGSIFYFSLPLVVTEEPVSEESESTIMEKIKTFLKFGYNTRKI